MRPHWPRSPITLLALMTSLFFSGCPGPHFANVNPETPTPSPSPPATPMPTPLPLRETYVPYSHKDVAKFFNGFEIHSYVNTEIGDQALLERKAPESYVLDLD